MNSPGPIPTGPGPGVRFLRLLLRTVLTLVPVVSIGVLAWVPLVRLAIVSGRVRDWLGCAVVAVLSTGGFVLVGSSHGDGSWQTVTGMSLILGLGALVPVYFLVADIRLGDAARFRAQYAPSAHPAYWPTPTPYQALPTPYPAAPYPPVPHQPAPYPAAPYPAAPYPAVAYGAAGPGDRIDQVRAELDQLSDLLRKPEPPA